MDFKQPGTIHKPESSTKSTGYPGMWQFPKNPEDCCIYRVPHCIRQANPEAYSPQLVIIGPLHHSLKSQALKSLGDITDTKSMGYLNMEEHKKRYLTEFAKRIGGIQDIEGLRRIIKENEEKIRESYSESTDWIESPKFVEMILLDSVFILEFMLRLSSRRQEKIGDPLMDQPCLENNIREDIILLENQLPYFILEKLFDPIIPILFSDQTFRHVILCHFALEDNIRNSTFKHFTDLTSRIFHMETLPERKNVYLQPFQHIHMYNATKLHSVGVKFENAGMHVRFENGCLKMPCLIVSDNSEMVLRNVMAFEQCHDMVNAQVCAYISFLDFLIDTDKDVDLLVEKGIIMNHMGQHGLLAEMVNRLCLNILVSGSYYTNIATEINAYYSNPFNKSRALLKRVYFGNLWTGTTSVAAVSLLLMTLIQAVSSIIQLMHNAPSLP